MKNEGKIVELLTEMLAKHDIMIEYLRGIKNECISINMQFENTTSTRRLSDLETEYQNLKK